MAVVLPTGQQHTVVMPAGRLFTIDDLDRFPDDGNRYELIEGSLHVTPSPLLPHQEAVANAFRLLDRACPPDRKVLFAPLDIVLGPATVVQPDVMVLTIDERDEAKVRSTPLVVVEVLSPSTRSYDLSLKRRVYREGGVGSYWVVDPTRPAVTVWTWNGEDETEQEVTGDDALELTWPFPVTVVPAALTA